MHFWEGSVPRERPVSSECVPNRVDRLETWSSVCHMFLSLSLLTQSCVCVDVGVCEKEREHHRERDEGQIWQHGCVKVFEKWLFAYRCLFFQIATVSVVWNCMWLSVCVFISGSSQLQQRAAFPDGGSGQHAHHTSGLSEGSPVQWGSQSSHSTQGPLHPGNEGKSLNGTAPYWAVLSWGR